jgi:NADH-quinone oxidoreductase subunit H
VSFELGAIVSHAFQLARTWMTARGMPEWGALLTTMSVETIIVISLVLFIPVVMVYAERKISAAMQARLGPTETGPWGLFQTIADTVKLLFKEDIIPVGGDPWLHRLAPIVAVAPAFVCFAAIPFGIGLIPVDMDTGVLFIFAVSGVSTIGVLLAGWGSGNKYSMLGGIRGAAQLVSYEIPRVLSVVPALMLYQSLSLRVIAEAQQGRLWGFFPKWLIFYPFGFIGFLLFLICSVAETNRTPFDIPEAESELVAGYHTEFSGFKFALFFLAEYAYIIVSSAMAVALFFGGGDGPTIAGGHSISWIWFQVKMAPIAFLFIWFRWTFPRLRVDRLMQFCWQFLLPLSFVNILATAGWILWRG